MLGHNEIEGYEMADQLIKNGVKKQLVAPEFFWMLK